jgi:hypothetical protein
LLLGFSVAKPDCPIADFPSQEITQDAKLNNHFWLARGLKSFLAAIGRLWLEVELKLLP